VAVQPLHLLVGLLDQPLQLAELALLLAETVLAVLPRPVLLADPLPLEGSQLLLLGHGLALQRLYSLAHGPEAFVLELTLCAQRLALPRQPLQLVPAGLRHAEQLLPLLHDFAQCLPQPSHQPLLLLHPLCDQSHPLLVHSRFQTLQSPNVLSQGIA
jgi:hypothetical protein